LSVVRAISHGLVRLAARHGSRRLSDRRIVRIIGLEAEYAAMAARGSRHDTGLPNLDYPFHDRAATVTMSGRICFSRRKINLRSVFTGQSVG
jgi:hypothetical protein